MRPKLRLSRLRDIGWSKWDPIGLLGPNETWDGKSFADEYDTYLIQAAGQLRSNVPAEEVIGYLVGIEAEHMGLGAGFDSRSRAAAVVTAIQSDDELWSIPQD